MARDTNLLKGIDSYLTLTVPCRSTQEGVMCPQCEKDNSVEMGSIGMLLCLSCGWIYDPGDEIDHAYEQVRDSLMMEGE